MLLQWARSVVLGRGRLPSVLKTYRTCVMSGRENKDHSWTYENQSAWGEVPGWEVASTGKRQSPIDIKTADLIVNENLTPLKLEGWDSPLHGTFQNTGHSLQFTPDSSKTLLSTPHGTFAFQQFHFHWGTNSNQGSEHCVNGNSYAAEIHFVHMKTSGSQDDNDSLAVVGVFCQADNECDEKVWGKIEVPDKTGQVAKVKDITISSYVPSELDYYYYKGSLTTPPCSEKVLWYVIKQPLKVPEEFLMRMRKMQDVSGRMLTYNHRQCMPLYDRLVETHK